MEASISHVVEGDEQEEGMIDVSMLIKSMENVMRSNQQQGGAEMDEISCLTDYSLPLSDIMEISENDVIFGPTEYCITNSNNLEGNRRFGKLINDYTRLYCTTTRQEDKCIVVAEVIRVWRSLEPPGRFLVSSTEPSQESFLLPPYNDIGDEDARRRATELLSRQGRGDNDNININNSTNKHHGQDDVTASTTDSSSTTNHDRRRETSAPATQSRQPLKRASHKDLYRGVGGGGSFRGLVMGLFGKDSIINQYL